ncbi:hypothetical protein LB507_005135 [Fusarium sp. FIESC RH6]|nr:hypothetical protein LB507_005135 [Fusarium sp. FIESC RH6]
MRSPPPPTRESRLRRALYALPFLAITALMTRAFGMAESIGPVIEQRVQTSVFRAQEGNVALIKNFYGVPGLDDIFNVVTAAFANLQFFFDKKAYWQSLVFLTDFAGMYAVIMVESFRPGNTFLVAKYPMFFLLLSQIIAIGCTAPIFFFLAYVFAPEQKLPALIPGRPGAGRYRALIPMLVLSYYIPHLRSYFSTSLEKRNWWNWIWQLYPVWGSGFMFVLSRAFRHEFKLLKADRIKFKIDMGMCSIISMVTWWYTVASMKDSIFEVFVPHYLVTFPQDPDVGLRTVIQYDYICCFAAGYLWLAYHFRDMKKVGICSVSWFKAVSVCIVLGFVIGPGTLFPILWLLREELLIAAEKKTRESED